MVFVVHRSSSPSAFCSPPVHRLSTLACLPARWVGLMENGSLPGECADLDYTAAAPPAPSSLLILWGHRSTTTACGGHSPIFLFSYSFLSIPTSDGRSALQGGQTEKRPPPPKSNSCNEHLQ